MITFLVCCGFEKNFFGLLWACEKQQLNLWCAGAQPGGGVQGAAGRNCALVVMSDKGKAMHS
jgi:phytoene dehydrogenase-like protein